MSIRLEWISEQKSFSMSAPTNIDFVSTRDVVGPNGGRMVIDSMNLVIEGVITVATQAVDGRDVHAWVSQISVEQNDGEQRNAPLTGPQHRLVTISQVGPESYAENLGVSIGAAQAVSVRIPIVYEQPQFAARGADWCLGLEMLRKITVRPATLAEASRGTAALSAATLNAYVEFFGHEEMFLEAKCMDEYSLVAFTSLTQVTASLSGPLLGAWLVSTSGLASATVGGGGSVSTITDYRIDGLSIPTTPRARRLSQYRLLRHRGNTSASAVAGEVYADPIQEGKMLPLLPPQVPTQAPWDAFTRGPLNLRFDVVPGQANLELLVRTAKKRSPKSWELSCRAFGIDPSGGGAKIKTADGRPMAIDGRGMYAPFRVDIPALSAGR